MPLNQVAAKLTSPRSSPRSKETLLSVAICILFVLAAYLVYHNDWFQDMSAVWIAAGFIADGQPDYMYLAPDRFFIGEMPGIWAERGLASGATDTSKLVPYVYPPLWAALLAPFTTVMSAQTFFSATQITQIVVLAIAPFLAWRIAGGTNAKLTYTAIAYALLYLSLPSALALFQNQPQILVTVLIVLAFERYSAGRSGQAGAILATAAAIKLTPAAFLLIFLYDRDPRAAAAFVLTFAAFALLSILLVGWDAHTVFLERVRQFDGHIIATAHNHSLSVIWAQISDWPAVSDALQLETPMMTLENPAFLGAAMKLVFLGSVLVFFRQTRQLGHNARLAVRVLGVGIMLALTAPVGWAHYYLLPVLFLPALSGLMQRYEALVWIALPLTLLSAPVLFLVQPSAHATALSVIVPVCYWVCLFARLCRLGRVEPASQGT